MTSLLRTELYKSSRILCTRETDLRKEIHLFFSSQQSQLIEPFVGIGVDPGFNASTTHQKTLTTDPFGNTCEEDEVSPEVEAGVVAGLRCLQP
jgi:hypothetical protein